MNADRLGKIRDIAARNIERLRSEAAAFRAAASADPLNADAVRRAVESRAIAAGYERAITEIVDGMIAQAVTS